MNTGNRLRKGVAGNHVSARFAYDCGTDLVLCLQAITVRKTRNARGRISLARSPWRDHDDRGCFLLPSTLQLGRAFPHRDYLNWVFAQPRASTESSAPAFPAFGIHLSPGFHARISPVCISQAFIRVSIGQRFSPAPNFRSFFAPNPHDISRPFLTPDMPLFFERSVSDTSLLFLSYLESADSSASFPFCVPFSDTRSPSWSTCALTNLFCPRRSSSWSTGVREKSPSPFCSSSILLPPRLPFRFVALSRDRNVPFAAPVFRRDLLPFLSFPYPSAPAVPFRFELLSRAQQFPLARPECSRHRAPPRSLNFLSDQRFRDIFIPLPS
jgi:hypothetical protein